MTQRELAPRQVDATGLPDGKIMTTLNETWVAGDPPSGGAVLPLTEPGDLVTYAAGTTFLELENPTPTGLVTASGSPSTTETVVSGCDLDLTGVGVTVDIFVDFWWSMNHGSVPKDVNIRVRRDDLSGEILASSGYVSAPVDNAGGHITHYTTTYEDVAPTTGRYVLTVQSQPGSSGSDIFSDTRVFEVSTTVLESPEVVRLPVSGVDGRVLTEDSTTLEGIAWSAVPQLEVIGVALSDETTAITTGTAKATIRMPFAMTLTAVRSSLSTASSSGLPTIDINENGATILSTKLSIDASEKTSVTAATPAVISDPSLADDAEITFDIDVAGTGAKGLKAWLIGYRT